MKFNFFKNMNEKFNNNSFIPSNAEIAQIPNVGVVIDIEKFKSVSKLISALEDLDDVQDVYANFDIEEKELEALLSE